VLLRRATTWLALLLVLSPLHNFLADMMGGGGNVSVIAILFGTESLDRLLGIAGVVGVVGSLLFVVARFWIWRLAPRGPGSMLLLSAAVVGVLIPLYQLCQFLLEQPWFVRLPDWFFRVMPLVDRMAWDWSWQAPPLSLLLLALGLYRSRLVPRWVPPIGVVAAVLFAWWSASVVGLLVQVPESYAAALMLEVVFLVAAGICVAVRGVRPSMRGHGAGAALATGAGGAVEHARPADGVGSEQQGDGAVHR
jgi:hypothetical protein